MTTVRRVPSRLLDESTVLAIGTTIQLSVPMTCGIEWRGDPGTSLDISFPRACLDLKVSKQGP